MKARLKYTKTEVILDVYPYGVEAGRITFKEIGDEYGKVYQQSEIEFIKEKK